MSSNNGFNSIPRLRFRGYNGEWEERTIEEVCTTITPPLKLQSTDYLSVGKYPIVDQSQSLICGWTDDETGLITKSPVIIFGDHTCVLKYIDFPFVQGADGVKILSPKKEYNPLYVYQALLANPVKQDGYKRHFSDLKEKTYLFPTSLEEQDKIAECLSEEDKIISAQAQKVVSLKELKKGLLQQLFPQNGETTPALRFPGFTGEWEEKKLVDLARKMNRRNRQLEVSRVLTNSANDGVMDQSEYFDRDIAVKGNTDNYHIVELNDFVYNPRISTAAPVGPISINRIGKGIMSPLYTVFKFHKGYVPFFEYYFQTTIWHPYLKSIANFGARFDRMNITSEGFFDMPIYLPSTQAEQQKIASCLSSLDDTIQSETDKLEALKAHKKGLMQQLFPQHS